MAQSTTGGLSDPPLSRHTLWYRCARPRFLFIPSQRSRHVFVPGFTESRDPPAIVMMPLFGTLLLRTSQRVDCQARQYGNLAPLSSSVTATRMLHIPSACKCLVQLEVAAPGPCPLAPLSPDSHQFYCTLAIRVDAEAVLTNLAYIHCHASHACSEAAMHAYATCGNALLYVAAALRQRFCAAAAVHAAAQGLRQSTLRSQRASLRDAASAP
jgi:hypothetical protein